MTTASDEMRQCLLDELPKSQHGKIGAIMKRFDQLIADASAPAMVHVNGARPPVETVEAYGLASTVEPIGVGLPQGLDVGEMEYS